jgi:hypothetical protein
MRDHKQTQASRLAERTGRPVATAGLVMQGRPAEVGHIFHRVSRKLLDEHPGDELGRMLQSVGLKTAGKFYAFATKNEVVVKLPAARVADLIATAVGRPCDPRGGRPMRQWVRLRPADEEDCTAYLIEARAFVATHKNR